MITLNDYQTLNDAGKVSRLESEETTIMEYEKYKEKNFEDLSIMEKRVLNYYKRIAKNIDEIKESVDEIKRK
ncbi:MAG: hypothetical protein LBU04_03065 [Christensenellaceae bacterium]|jgi:hypothetical protein|nr:hypothetical protein [Christensenellaceae bacterium]